MAREFGGAATDRLTVAASTPINDLNTVTVTAWIHPQTLGGGSFGRIIDKSQRLLYVASTAHIRWANARATTTALQYTAANSITLNTWHFLAATFSDSDTGHVYIGTLSTGGLTEATYDTNTAGAGAYTADNATALTIGNTGAATRNFDGYIANLMMWNTVLTVGELNAVMRGSMARASALAGWWPLWGISAPEPNWVGTGDGTVTGATRSDHPPGTGFPLMRSHRVQRLVAAAGRTTKNDHFFTHGTDVGLHRWVTV